MDGIADGVKYYNQKNKKNVKLLGWDVASQNGSFVGGFTDQNKAKQLTQGFLDWRAFSNRNPDMAIGKLLARSCPHLTPEEAAAYDAPFPDASYKAGVRRFPNLVPDRPDADGAALSREARSWFEREWTGRHTL